MLKLRKEVQEILNAKGLHSMHLNLSKPDYNKQRELSIVGKCNRSILRLDNIVLTKTSVNNTERRILLEIVADCIEQNILDLVEYSKLRKELDTLGIYKSKLPNCVVGAGAGEPSYLLRDSCMLTGIREKTFKLLDRASVEEVKEMLENYNVYVEDTKLWNEHSKLEYSITNKLKAIISKMNSCN